MMFFFFFSMMTRHSFTRAAFRCFMIMPRLMPMLSARRADNALESMIDAMPRAFAERGALPRASNRARL